MSDGLVKPSSKTSERRLRRLHFSPMADDLENQQTVKMPVAMPGREIRRGLFLPSRQPGSASFPAQASQDVRVAGDMGAAGDVGADGAEMVQTAPLPAIPLPHANGNGISSVGAAFRAQFIAPFPAATPPAPPMVLPAGKESRGAPLAEPFGFDIDDPEFDKFSTIPMIVLKGISKEEGKPQEEMKSEVSGAASAAGMVGLGNILGSVLKYVSTFLIQYSFGPGVYGIYVLSTSLVNLISSVFGLGMGDAMLRYVAIYRGKHKPRLLLGLTIFCSAMAGIAGLIGALLVLYFTPAFVALRAHGSGKQSSLEQVVPVLQMMAPLIPLFCMQFVWQQGLRGFKVFKFRVLVSNVLQPLIQIMLMVLVIIFFSNITGIVLALIISTLLSALLNFFFLLRQIRLVAIPEMEQYELREWLGFASLNFLSIVTDNLLYFMDALLLAIFNVSSGQIGQYGAATRITNFINLPLLSLNNIFAPTIAELHSKGERKKLESMFKVVTKWTITFSLPIFLVSALFAPYLLGLSGAGFVPAAPLVIALSIGALLNVGTGAVGYMLQMTGYNKLSFLNSLVAVIVNVALGVLLIPHYGAMGTAIGTGVSFAIVNLMKLLQVRLLLKMHPYRWDVLKPIGAGLISSAVIGTLFYLLSISHLKLFILLGHAILSVQLLLIPVFLALYIGLIVLFKGSVEDEIVMKALRKKFSRGKKRGKNQKKPGDVTYA